MEITRRAALALTGVAVAAPVFTGTAAATTGRGRVVRTSLVTEVTPRDNWRVTAVVVEFAGPVDARGTAFEVTATVNGQTAPRTVTGVSARGARLTITLDPADPNARAAGADPYPLDRAYAVRQVAGTPLFPFAVRNDDVVNPVVDDFTAGTFTDPTGYELDFRLREPKGAGPYPLVVTLHGGGEVADNNMTQLTGTRIAVTFARSGRPPLFVLSPQVPLPRPMNGPDGTDWADPKVRAATGELIAAFMAAYPVDRRRVYLVGLSSGARGAYGLLARHPGRFAAAVATAGWSDVSVVDGLRDVPLWVDHSEDDPVVPYREGRFGNPGTWTLMNLLETAGTKVTRGTWPNDLAKPEFEARSRELSREARRTGSHVLFTTYPAGTTPVNPHLAWAQTYENDVIVNWLLAQRLR